MSDWPILPIKLSWDHQLWAASITTIWAHYLIHFDAAKRLHIDLDTFKSLGFDIMIYHIMIQASYQYHRRWLTRVLFATIVYIVYYVSEPKHVIDPLSLNSDTEGKASDWLSNHYYYTYRSWSKCGNCEANCTITILTEKQNLHHSDEQIPSKL